ncbi:hypothetical protein AS594_07160 [Streptomyces agglomeratus]|uniref:Uncharacterized protein n=1 Tax=Streptomyces agglomeratus TaxID=285458 RepID=A0A1E5P422_9ACTN|nr:hypothetical protein [Streptomyces agglomeratus]OEJ24301.1 hypothetical protein AS594_07160 [Streptomyces agglomeratus]
MNDDTGSVAVALADLRGAVDTGFAKLNGRLDVALQRTDTVEREVAELKVKLSTLESKVWKWSVAAAAVGTGGATGLWQLLNGG